MIWIIYNGRSMQAIGINVVEKGNQSELWAEKPDGSSRKLLIGEAAVVKENKDAIDFAIQNGHKTYEVK